MIRFLKATALLAVLLFSQALQGALPVTDAAMIALERLNAHRDYLEQLLQTENEIAQVKNLVQQIIRIDESLKRLGNPGEISQLAGADAACELLQGEELNQTSEALVQSVKGEEIFTSSGPIVGLQKDIEVDGRVVGQRAEDVYGPDAVLLRGLKQYQQIRSQVLHRRSALKRELAAAIEQIKAASTTSEVMKLTAVVSALQAEMESLDRDLQFAAMETSHLSEISRINSEILRKANVEDERAVLSESSRRDVELFQLPTTPITFCPQ